MSAESGIHPISNYRNFRKQKQDNRWVGAQAYTLACLVSYPITPSELRYGSRALIEEYQESSMDPEWTCKSSRSIADEDAIGFLRDFLGSASSDRTMMDEDVTKSSHPSGADTLRADAQMNPPRKYTYADMSRLLKGMKADVRAQRARE
jgi:hypothetical protein